MSVSRTVSEIFSIKSWRDLEIWVWSQLWWSFKATDNGAVL